MNKQNEEQVLAGLDYATFLGVVLAIIGPTACLVMVLMGGVAYEALGGLAAASALVAVLGHSLITKGLGYKAVCRAIREHTGVWIAGLTLCIGGGAIMASTATFLLTKAS